MIKHIHIYTVVLALFMVGCVRELDTQVADEVQETVQTIVPGQAIVQFDDAMIELIEADLQAGNLVTKSAALNEIKAALGIESMTRVFSHGGEFEPRHREAGLHKWYRVEFSSDVPVTKATADLAEIGGIESVEPVRVKRSTSTFNDPRLKYQWHYYNDGTLDSSHKKGADVNVVPVWENYTTGSPDVIVAVVDGGVDFNHEDLKDNYIGGRSFIRNIDKVVPHDHGSHVAGTIAAVNNNGIGVSGLAGGDAANNKPGVKILSCQITAADPQNPGKELWGSGEDAIVWGADNGAVISQNSWGYTYESAEDAAAASKQGLKGTALAKAIDYFIAYAGKDANGKQVGPMAGGIVIFASGNSAYPNDPIGEYEPVLSVGAIAPDYTRTYYSNYGDWVDIAAPGGSYEYSQGQILSTVPGGYEYFQGTSMACPQVSGVAALVVSHHGGPGFTSAKLREKLIKGANSAVMSKNAKIGPLVDALGAMTYGGKTPPAAVNAAEVSARSNNITLTWNVTSDPDDNKAWGYRIVASKNKADFATLKPGSIPEGTPYVEVLTESLKVGESISGTIADLDFESDYYVAVSAFDFRRNYSAFSPVCEAHTEGNNAPVVTTSYDGDFKVKSHETLEIDYKIVDPDGHKIKVEYTNASAADVLMALEEDTFVFAVVGNADEPGKYTSKIKVTDAYGLETVHEVNFEILENHAPVIVKDVEDMFFDMMGQKMTLDMSDYLDDPDGEQLSFEISMSNKAILHINPAENLLHATTLMYGSTDVTIVAKDSRGLTCTLTFKVVVKDPKKPLEVYPNPVVDWLNISTLDVVPTHISIVSSTGKSVYDQTQDVGAVEPARIDMSSCAPGVYNLLVEFSGESYKKTIVKL